MKKFEFKGKRVITRALIKYITVEAEDESAAYEAAEDRLSSLDNSEMNEDDDYFGFQDEVELAE